MTPGSPDAVKAGCKCAIGDNGNGAGYMGQEGVFWINGDCPLHGAPPASDGAE